jgi:hypothetical protein
LVLVVAYAMGYGDDPVVGGIALSN